MKTLPDHELTARLDQAAADAYLVEVGRRKHGHKYGDAELGGILRRWSIICERQHIDQEALATVIDVWSGLKQTDQEIRRRLYVHIVANDESVPTVKVKRGSGYRWGYPEPEALRAEADRLAGEAAVCEAQGDIDEAAALRRLELRTRHKIRLVRVIRHAAGKVNHTKATSAA